MSDKLPVLFRQELGVSLNPQALALRDTILERSALIGKVDSVEAQAEAVAVQVELAKLAAATEKSRKEVKEPFIESGRLVDSLAKSFIEEVGKEKVRIAALNADFTALQLAKERSAQAATNATLSAIEQERELALAAAATLEDRDRIQEEYDTKVRSVPAVETHRAEGQVIRREWDVQVLDVHALYRAHPNCCKITPLMSEIKALLDDGIVVRGVKAERVVRSGVRTT